MKTPPNSQPKEATAEGRPRLRPRAAPERGCAGARQRWGGLVGPALVGLASTGACWSKLTVVTTGDDDAGSTTSHTTTSTTTSSTTGTTSSTTSTACSADLTSAVGATEACNACVGESCCAEAEDYESTVNQASYEALLACAMGPGGEGPCHSQCVSTVCNTAYAFAFHQACAECLTASCCTQFDACGASDACDACVWNFQVDCCNNDLFQAWVDCYSGPCASACGYSDCGSGA